MTDLERELIDLVLILGAALTAAGEELEMLRETPAPMPDDLDVRLTERLILIETLKRFRAEAPDHVVELVVEMYRQEREKAPHDDYELPNFPPLPEVEQQIEAAAEEVRRRAWLVPDLWAADYRGLLRRSAV